MTMRTAGVDGMGKRDATNKGQGNQNLSASLLHAGCLMTLRLRPGLVEM